MSFPDDFILPEDQSMTSVARQIGNAVPCLLAQRIAAELASSLDGRTLSEPDVGSAPFEAEPELAVAA